MSIRSLCKDRYGVSTPSVSVLTDYTMFYADKTCGTIDQMGVELGKVLAKNILAQLDKPEDVKGHDSSVSTY